MDSVALPLFLSFLISKIRPASGGRHDLGGVFLTPVIQEDHKMTATFPVKMTRETIMCALGNDQRMNEEWPEE